jgi:acyl-lipid omega-6 desaturase (Delta-12 desaturase)
MVSSVEKGDSNRSNQTMHEERKRHISSYRATYQRFFYEFLTTAVAYTALLLSHGPNFCGVKFWIVGPFVLLRMFIVFHDCGHNSFAPSIKMNKILHRVLSVLITTPTRWRESHRRHHQYVGSTENDIDWQWNDTIYWTKKELNEIRPMVLRRFLKFIRYPPIYFPIAAFYEWNIRHRMPVLDPSSGYTTLDNTINTIVVLVYVGLVYLWKGNSHMIIDMYISGLIAETFGLIMFHTQHSFEHGYRVTYKEWDMVDAAFSGSSCSIYPSWLQWSTMGIEYHHIHHYDAQVPGYLLRECYEQGISKGYWKGVNVLDMPAVWTAIWTTVYDEEQKKYTYY